MKIQHRMKASPSEYRAALSVVAGNSILCPVARRVKWLEELISKLLEQIEDAEDAETVVLYHIGKEAQNWPLNKEGEK